MGSAVRWRPLVAAICSATLLGGCTTIRSNLYEPDETGERKPKKLHGIPVAVVVPTHLKISLDETHYYTTADGALKPIPMKPTYDLRHELIYSKEIYTTDFRRPPSGSIDLKLDMDTTNRYFNKINDSTVDTTITDVAALVQTIISKSPTLFPVKALAKGTGNANEQPADGKGAPGLTKLTLSVASEVFDIRQPNLEGRVRAFLDEQLNRCTARCAGGAAACPAPAPLPVFLPNP